MSGSALGAAGGSRARARCRRCASCAAPRCSASTTAAPMARWSASPIICRCRRRISRASGCGRSSPSARVLAAGAIERPIVFGGNDRPGVMMASAVRTYVNRFGVAPGRRVVVFTTTRRRLADRRRSRRCRRRSRGDRRCARAKSTPRCLRRPSAARRACCSGARVVEAHGGRGARAASTVRDARRTHRADCRPIRSRCPAAGIRTSRLTTHLGGTAALVATSSRLRAGRRCRVEWRSSAPPRLVHACRCLRDGARGRRRGRGSGGLQRAGRAALPRRRRASGVSAVLARRASRAAKPSSTSRTM